MDSVTRFFASGFFLNQFPPNPQYTIRTVSNFFEKFAEIFATTTPVTNFATSFASVVDTGGKFAAGVNNRNNILVAETLK